MTFIDVILILGIAVASISILALFYIAIAAFITIFREEKR